MKLCEFDPEKRAVINPSDVCDAVPDMPKVAVCCYSHVTFERLVSDTGADVKIAESSNANMELPIYKAVYSGHEIALFMMPVGAPASAAMLEDVYAMGAETIIVFGTCGVLDASVEDCSVIIPKSAVRDEGTSCHYAPPSDEIAVNEKYFELFVSLLRRLGVSYTAGKVWTTDAIYRETPAKVQRRREEGCICVDMECSANAALAKFRKKEIVQFFYAADNLDSEKWEARSLGNHAMLEEKDKIAALAMELAGEIAALY